MGNNKIHWLNGNENTTWQNMWDTGKATLKGKFRASMVAQWLRIHLLMQGTQVQALVWEDPTCHGATKAVCHSYWACTSQLLKPMHREPMLYNKRSHCIEKPAHHNEEQPPLAATRESLHAAMKAQCSQK